MNRELQERILTVASDEDFRVTALELFRYQYFGNPVYREFSDYLGKTPGKIGSPDEIPFLPIEFFRNHKIITGNRQPQAVFTSSGTTGSLPSKHYIADLKLYETSFLKAFRFFYGDPEEFVILALLPSYTEREGSSLVYMADKLIQLSQHKLSGFYKSKHDILISAIEQSRGQGRKILLLGVSFALLDLAENESPDLSDVLIMETGGMKGRRKEITRAELHEILRRGFHSDKIHSEYGMTELLSQAYSTGNEIFRCPSWMKIMIRDPYDPLFIYSDSGKTGGINIIDLANINSCSFIATGDLGKLKEDGSFEVLGRFDNSDIRGCNLMAE
jgi:hypothetical protein